MSTYFPQLSSGVMTHRPYGQRPTFSTQIQDIPSGMRYSFAEFGAGLTNFPTVPLGRYDLKYASMSDADAATLAGFFASMEGQLQEFTYLDPGGNLVTASENFSDTSWTGSFTGAAATDPWGGTRATTCSSVTLTTSVIPSGGVSGFILTGSVYVKPTAAGVVTIVVAGQSANVGAPAGRWTRASSTITVASGSAVAMSFEIPAGAMFGAQCAALPGPGAYRKTPGSEALRETCRFDMDDLVISKVGPNENEVSISILEYFG